MAFPRVRTNPTDGTSTCGESLNQPSKPLDYKSCSLIIDLKPYQKETNLSLYELLDVWGFSDHSWTPVMLRLSGLFVDEDDPEVIAQRQDFVLEDDEIDGPIYEFMYIAGSVHGAWNDGTLDCASKGGDQRRPSVACNLEILHRLYQAGKPRDLGSLITPYCFTIVRLDALRSLLPTG